MRRIALINQKGGVGKTTSTVNLGAALARAGRRVLLVDLDPQANLSLHLDHALEADEPSTYSVLIGNSTVEGAIRPTKTDGLQLVASNIDLSGAELELASAFGRESLLKDALTKWEAESRASTGEPPVDYVLLDCPPSLGLLSINGLVAAQEVIVAMQTEFFALQGISKLMDVFELIRQRLNPDLAICGILPCLYDSRLKLAREVLAEIRKYFPGQVLPRPIAKNIKLAEAPSYGQTIFEYAPDSPGAQDYAALADEILGQEPEEALPEELAEITLKPKPAPEGPAEAPAEASPAETRRVGDPGRGEGLRRSRRPRSRRRTPARRRPGRS